MRLLLYITQQLKQLFFFISKNFNFLFINIYINISYTMKLNEEKKNIHY